MKNILVFSPSDYHKKEIFFYAQDRNCNLIFDQQLDLLRKQISSPSNDTNKLNFFLNAFLEHYHNIPVDGIINCADYFAAAIASIMAQKWNIAAPIPETIFICCDQYRSRMYQKTIVPEAVLNFVGIDALPGNSINPPFEFPFLMRPILGHNSHLQEITTQDEFRRYIQENMYPDLFQLFNYLVDEYTPTSMKKHAFLAEQYFSGKRHILEGFFYKKDCIFFGLIDVLSLDHILPHVKYEYPSSLHEEVQIRMKNIAQKIIYSLAFDNGFFTIEFIYDEKKNWIGIIAINPQIHPEFSDLYERVDGNNSYVFMLDMALGKEPRMLRNRGSFALAARCILSVNTNCYVAQVPSEKSLQRLEARFPDVKVDVLVKPGSHIIQKWATQNYNYGAINLGAHDTLDLLNRFNVCCSLLDFKLVPT